ncbi:MAG: hypothetical protein ACE5GE_07445 [Phycisphaerae bacterium]
MGLVALLLAIQPASAAVIGRIVQVGYPGTTGDLVRDGDWAPVLVDLTLEGDLSFEGFLRVSQPDKDGDLPYDRVRVQLRADSGNARRYVLYCPIGPGDGPTAAVSVMLLDADGELVQVISEITGKPTASLSPAQPPERVPDRNLVILSVSNRSVGKVSYLESPEQADKFYRSVRVAHIQPSALPDRWIGLEMVDAIVWDAADATDLTSQQIEALITWVRHGGWLLMAAAKTSDTLAQNQDLAQVLPVKLGRVVDETRMGELRWQLLGGARYVPGSQERVDDPKVPFYYAQPLPLVLCTTVPGATTLVAERDLNATVAARRSVGRGRVVFIAAEIHDLLDESKLKPTVFFKRTLEIREPRNVADNPPTMGTLFPYLEQTVGFRRSTGVYLLAALLFSVAYVGLSTFGSWVFLRSRGWTRHAWTAFSIVAAAAAVLSLLAVQSMRGVGQSLQQLTVVDAVAGQTQAQATAYFGIKTGTHSLLDVWMPSDYTAQQQPERTACSLKPLPASSVRGAGSSSYTDTTRYHLVPASASMEDVPVRATLKQFEGRWFGDLRHTLEADVRLIMMQGENRSGLGIAPGSTVTNRLGHTLTHCVLIQPLENAFKSDIDLTLNLATQYILVHRIGDIADGQTVDLNSRIYTDLDTGALVSVDTWLTHTLAESQTNWGDKFRTGNPFGGGSQIVENFRQEDYQDALLMLTALTDHRPDKLTNTMSPAGYDFDALHCRQLDRSDDLTTDSVMLIGFAEDQGPVTLCTRTGKGAYKPRLADQAYTMYRFVIPVRKP